MSGVIDNNEENLYKLEQAKFDRPGAITDVIIDAINNKSYTPELMNQARAITNAKAQAAMKYTQPKFTGNPIINTILGKSDVQNPFANVNIPESDSTGEEITPLKLNPFRAKIEASKMENTGDKYVDIGSKFGNVAADAIAGMYNRQADEANNAEQSRRDQFELDHKLDREKVEDSRWDREFGLKDKSLELQNQALNNEQSRFEKELGLKNNMFDFEKGTTDQKLKMAWEELALQKEKLANDKQLTGLQRDELALRVKMKEMELNDIEEKKRIKNYIPSSFNINKEGALGKQGGIGVIDSANKSLDDIKGNPFIPASEKKVRMAGIINDAQSQIERLPTGLNNLNFKSGGEEYSQPSIIMSPFRSARNIWSAMTDNDYMRWMMPDSSRVASEKDMLYSKAVDALKNSNDYKKARPYSLDKAGWEQRYKDNPGLEQLIKSLQDEAGGPNKLQIMPIRLTGKDMIVAVDDQGNISPLTGPTATAIRQGQISKSIRDLMLGRGE